MTFYKLFVLATILAFSNPSFAKQIIERSGPPAQLIELYTSQGCSSCPPADNYLRRLVDSPLLWKEMVPLAFHVDYWDYIGWTDRFAQPEFKQRQYDYRKTGAINSVYTPGWVVDGREWRGFFTGAPLPKQSGKPGGKLTAVIDNKTAVINFQPTAKNSSLTMHLAVLGFDFSTKIARGENSGKLLKHQFVVLDKQQQSKHNREWRFELPELEKSRRYALAIWVAEPGKSPLQVAGAWLE